MRVCAGIITGLHVQSAGFIVHGSELYINIGIFQSSASARNKNLGTHSDLPTSRPKHPERRSAGPVRPQLWVPFGRYLTIQCL